MPRLTNDCFPNIDIVAEPTPPRGGYCKCFKPGCQRIHDATELPASASATGVVLRWKKTPKAMANELRRIADWLEKHGSRDIFVTESAER